MLSRPDAAQVCEGDNDPDCAVTAHAKISDVVKEDDACDARFVARFAQERADEYVGAAGLVDDGGPETVVMLPKSPELVGDRTAAQVGSPADDDACGFAAGMGIDDLDSRHVFFVAVIGLSAGSKGRRSPPRRGYDKRWDEC